MTSTAYDDQFAECTPEEEEAFKAIEDYRKQLHNSAEESAKRNAERAEARASKHEQENMQLRTENHTLRQAIRIVNES